MNIIMFGGSSMFGDFVRVENRSTCPIVVGVGFRAGRSCSKMDCAESFICQICVTMDYLVSTVDASNGYPLDVLTIAYDMPLFPTSGSGPFLPSELTSIWHMVEQDEHILDLARSMTRSVYSALRFDYVFTYGADGPTCEQLSECGFSNPTALGCIDDICDVLRYEGC